MGPPDIHRARERYRHLAARYDRLARWSDGLRRTAVERLELGPGGVVLDVGCGTGLSFPRLEAAVGAQGRVVGIELSSEMLAQAAERVERHGWENITLVAAAAHEAQIPVTADAALFFLTHDIMRTPAALEAVLGHVVPGGRVVAVGAKWAPPKWVNPLNLIVALVSRRYVTTFEGFDRPWSHLERLLSAVEVEPVVLGGAYLASGTVTGDEKRSAPAI